MCVEEAFRVNGNVITGGREVIARMNSPLQKFACLRSRSKLKGTDLYINEDVSYATQQIRKGLMSELRKKSRQGIQCLFLRHP